MREVPAWTGERTKKAAEQASKVAGHPGPSWTSEQVVGTAERNFDAIQMLRQTLILFPQNLSVFDRILVWGLKGRIQFLREEN